MTSLLFLAADAPFQPLHPLRYWGYEWWSGLGSNLAYLGMLLTALVIAWHAYRTLHHHFECHDSRCSKLGFHRVEGTPYRTCWPHHPELGGHRRAQVSAAQIRQAHRDARDGRDG